jgi:hypothetical protein
MVLFVDEGDTTVPWRVESVLQAREACLQAGIPVFPNVWRAARALALFTSYHRTSAAKDRASSR